MKLREVSNGRWGVGGNPNIQSLNEGARSDLICYLINTLFLINSVFENDCYMVFVYQTNQIFTIKLQ